MLQVRRLVTSRMWKPSLSVGAWALGICIPFYIKDPFFLHVLNIIFIGITMALSWGILARTGYISFASNAFLGIGAYTSAYLVMQLHIYYWIGYFAAGAMAGFFALFLGKIILRLKGIFFVLSTFCFAQIMLRVFRTAEHITKGADGITGIPTPILPFIGSLESHAQFYVLFYVYATFVVIFTMRLYNSNIGREFKAIGEDMFVAESMGIDTTRRKIIAFVISSIITGLSGSFHAHYTSFISDTTFEMTKSIEVMAYNVVGGMGSIIGPIIGVCVMVPLPEFLRGFVAYQIALYGLILILILRFFPAGIWGTIRRAHSTIPAESKSLRLSYELTKEFKLGFGNPIRHNRETLLECRKISRYFGGLAALTDISFSIRAGEILGIVGPNGAGKSTLFNVITKVLSPTRGTIIFEGKNITGLRPHRINRMGIARVFQSKVLYPEASVKENIVRAIVARSGFNEIKDFFGLERRKHQVILEQTQQVLELCGLYSATGELPKNLPHGFQRLVGLAVALATKPKLLLLDEPITGMSLEESDIIARILENLHQSGLTIIMVEHNVNFVMRICHRIMVLDYGQKIAEGTPQEIRRNPEVIKAFLGG